MSGYERRSDRSGTLLIVYMSIVFTKLASQLTAEKFTDLAIIPAIFVVMTAVSYFCSYLIARLFRFKKRQANFVTAMAVCLPYLATRK